LSGALCNCYNASIQPIKERKGRRTFALLMAAKMEEDFRGEEDVYTIMDAERDKKRAVAVCRSTRTQHHLQFWSWWFRLGRLKCSQYPLPHYLPEI